MRESSPYIKYSMHTWRGWLKNDIPFRHLWYQKRSCYSYQWYRCCCNFIRMLWGWKSRIGCMARNGCLLQQYSEVQKCHQIVPKVWKTLSKALLGFHALTGSDYSASFSRRGKVAPFKKLEKKWILSDSTRESWQLWIYIWRSHGPNRKICMSNVRLPKILINWWSKTRNICSKISIEKKGKNLFAKNLHSNIFPPCKRVLQTSNKLHRR